MSKLDPGSSQKADIFVVDQIESEGEREGRERNADICVAKNSPSRNRIHSRVMHYSTQRQPKCLHKHTIQTLKATNTQILKILYSLEEKKEEEKMRGTPGVKNILVAVVMNCNQAKKNYQRRSRISVSLSEMTQPKLALNKNRNELSWGEASKEGQNCYGCVRVFVM